MKNALIILIWFVTTIGLYAGLLILEFYWNVPAWRPINDSIARFLVAWPLAMVAVYWLLTRVSVNRVTQAISALICLALAALAIYVAREEPVKFGLFERPMPSPLWYRGGLAAILMLPGVLWFIGWRRAARTLKDKTATTQGT